MTAISLFEVGPRDGLQNEPAPVSQDMRKAWILDLYKAGLREIEVGALVREDRVPQMAGSLELYAALNQENLPDAKWWVLAPNKKGVVAGLEAGMTHLSLLAAASDTFNQKNIGKTVEESLADLDEQLSLCREAKAQLRVYLSCAWHCPYEGPVAPDKVLDITRRILDLGIDEIAVSDTIGKATPLEVRTLCEGLLKLAPLQTYSLHLHDTYAMAVANIQAALDLGFTRFDASAGGLGGCPYAKGASGNVATEDVLNLLQSQGHATGVDLSCLVTADQRIEEVLGRPLPSKVFQALKRQKQPA